MIMDGMYAVMLHHNVMSWRDEYRFSASSCCGENSDAITGHDT